MSKSNIIVHWSIATYLVYTSDVGGHLEMTKLRRKTARERLPLYSVLLWLLQDETDYHAAEYLLQH